MAKEDTDVLPIQITDGDVSVTVFVELIRDSSLWDFDYVKGLIAIGINDHCFS